MTVLDLLTFIKNNNLTYEEAMQIRIGHVDQSNPSALLDYTNLSLAEANIDENTKQKCLILI